MRNAVTEGVAGALARLAVLVEVVVPFGQPLGGKALADVLDAVAERPAAVIVALEVRLLGELLEGDEVIGLGARAFRVRGVDVPLLYLAGVRVPDGGPGEREGPADFGLGRVDGADALFQEGAAAALDLPQHGDGQVRAVADVEEISRNFAASMMS